MIKIQSESRLHKASDRSGEHAIIHLIQSLQTELGVNAKTSPGHDLLLRLAALSDLVIENNAVGVMDALGLGFERLSHLNPDIVMVSSQLMGTTGPWAPWRGYGPSTLGPSGVLSLWDYADTADPTGGGTIFPDNSVGR